jgi:hypothetical protein
MKSYISFDLHKISTLTFIIGQTILPIVKQKKPCVHFFFIYPKMLLKGQGITQCIEVESCVNFFEL